MITTSTGRNYVLEGLPERATSRSTARQRGFNFTPAEYVFEMTKDKYDTNFTGLESVASGTLTANPNPIQVCDGSGLGQTTLSWTTTG